MENLAQDHEAISENMKSIMPNEGYLSQIGEILSTTSTPMGVETARGDIPSRSIFGSAPVAQLVVPTPTITQETRTMASM